MSYNPGGNQSSIFSSFGTRLRALELGASPRLVRMGPGVGWNGTAGSGFAINPPPADPARTTAKPALRLLVPDRQRFVNQLLIGFEALCNNNGTMIGGVSNAIIHVDGASYDVGPPTFQEFPDANGALVKYWGYWGLLDREQFPARGDFQIVLQAIPADPTMQHQISPAYLYTHADNERDLKVTVGSSGAMFTDLKAAMTACRNADAPQIDIITPGPWSVVGGTGSPVAPKNRLQITASVPCKIGLPAQGADSASYFRPTIDGIHFKGQNVVLDFANMLQVYSENTGIEHWFDGCRMVDSLGGNRHWRGTTRPVAGPVRGSPWATEASADGLVNPFCGASGFYNLVRGVDLQNCSGDLFSEARMVKDVSMKGCNSAYFSTDIPSLIIQYVGADATATASFTGPASASSKTLTLKNGGTTADFTVSNSYAAFVANTNYTVQNVVDWVKTQPGWTASTLNNTRAAIHMSLQGLKGTGFSLKDAKYPLTIVTMIDAHGDAYQQNVINENVIVDGMYGYDMSLQVVFATGGNTFGLNDAYFVNIAVNNADGLTATYDSNLDTFCQFAKVQSNVVMAHVTLPKQGVRVSNAASYQADKYCMFKNMAVRSFTLTNPSSPILGEVSGLFLQGGQSLPLGADNSISVGSSDNLFVDAETGDMRPKGLMLLNLRVPVVAHAKDGRYRLPIDAIGAIPLLSF